MSSPRTPKKSVAEAVKAQDAKLQRKWSGVTATNKVKDKRMIITSAGLAQLKAYKYQSGAYTPLDNFLNKYWWTPASEYVPSNIAPNLITLTGLLFVVFGYFLITYYCPKFEETAPWWVYWVAGSCIFIYQTLDAIDGKQARKTGSSSPLGQLFDHGCDSVSTTFIMLTTAAAVQSGPTYETLVLLFGVQIPFFLAQWQEYHTHIMSTAVGTIGVTEGHYGSIVAMLLSGIVGPQFYSTKLHDLGPVPEVFGFDLGQLNVRQAALIVFTLAVSYMSLGNIWATMTKAQNRLAALIQLIPMCLLVMFGFLWSADPDENSIYRSHPKLTAGTLGMLFTHMTNQMILCGMTHMQYDIKQWLLIPLPFVFINSYYEISPRHDDVIFGVYCGVGLVTCYMYVRNVIEEICSSLGIYCLKLGPRQEKDD